MTGSYTARAVYVAPSGLVRLLGCVFPGLRFASPWAVTCRPFGAYLDGNEHDGREELADEGPNDLRQDLAWRIADRDGVRRIPVTQIRSMDPPRLFPLGTGESIGALTHFDLVLLDQDGVLTLLRIMETDDLGALKDAYGDSLNFLESRRTESADRPSRPVTMRGWDQVAGPGWESSGGEEAIGEFFGKGFLPRLWELVEENLRERRIRYIVAVRRLPEEVERLVNQMRAERKVSVYALEVGDTDASEIPWRLVGNGADADEHGRGEWFQYVVKHGEVISRTKTGCPAERLQIRAGALADPLEVVFTPDEPHESDEEEPELFGDQALAKAREELGASALPLPPFPADIVPSLRRLGAWCYATRMPEFRPYNFAEFAAAARAGRVEDIALLAQAGHGINSWALHYYLVQGPLHLFIQLGWGGVYNDEARARAEITACYALAAEIQGLAKEAMARGVLTETHTLTVAISDFYGSWWKEETVDPPSDSLFGDSDSERWAQSDVRCDPWNRKPPQEVLQEVVAWLRSQLE